MWLRGHSRSLKLVTFESLGTVSHLPSIVTMAVSLAILEIVWVPYSAPRWSCPKTVTPGTNQAECRVTTFIKSNVLPLHQTGNEIFRHCTGQYIKSIEPLLESSSTENYDFVSESTSISLHFLAATF